ncbi:MAG: type IV pilin protein [Xanthomonadales bacterium]|nr:type IV pilin protein [Xanthomonadales bacterium]
MKRQRAFSLIELMIVVGIVALLVALALPSYKQFMRKSHRGEAQQLMMNYANLQEIWRSNNPLYATAAQLALPTADRFTLYVRATASSPPSAAECANQNPTASAYTVVACASGDQVNDKQSGTSCTRMSLSQANAKTPAVCW